MDAMLDNLRAEWLSTEGNPSAKNPVKQLTVLQTLERSVSDNEELGEILKTIRAKVESNEIDENDFRQIHTEIIKQKQARKARQEKKGLPAGVLKSQGLMLFLEKEIARSRRYNTPFSALAFSVVKASPKEKGASGTVTQEALTDAVLQKLAKTVRETDVIGQLGKNKIVALLPMTTAEDAKLALRRVMKKMHLEPLEVNEVPLDLKIAGVVTNTELHEAVDTDAFVKTLSTQLVDMAARIKNIHAYF
jgi:GGDEF domain-containing protein